MSPFTRNTIQIGGTALITTLVFLTCNLIKTGEAWTINSGPITWEQAKDLKGKYEKSSRALKVKYKSRFTNKDTMSVLKGFVFSSYDLDSLINKNKSGRPDSVVLYFGKRGEFRQTPLQKRDSLHIIAVGLKNGVILETDVYDKADPCPPYCPDN